MMHNHLTMIGKVIAFSIILFLPHISHAQYSERQMYVAFLTSDMEVWNNYLHNYQWSKLTQQQRLRYLNYEYGYVSTAIEQKKADAQQHLDDYGAHIQAMHSVLSESQYLTYSSAYAAYRAKMSTWEFASQGVKAMNLAKDAVKADSNNPIALVLLGCVDFYAPSLFGGSKTRALENFKKSYTIFRTKGDTVNNWYYASVCMQLVMCLDKTGHTDEAICLCQQILRKDPEFIFIRDQYLPELLKKKNKK